QRAPRGESKKAAGWETPQALTSKGAQERLDSFNDRFEAICQKFWCRLANQPRGISPPATPGPHKDALVTSLPPQPEASLEHSTRLPTPPAAQLD
ncbi:Hypothetical predicted protein, partial [Pelobates cultripes]